MSGEDFFNGSDASTAVDVLALFDSGLPNEIARLVGMGVLVSIGTTRDRGALSITVTRDGRYRREYFRDASEAADFVRMAASAIRGPGLGEPEQDPTSTRKPSRGPRRASRGPA